MTTLLHPFSGTEAKAKEPINEDLTDKKYKENIEDLCVRIDAISGGGGTTDPREFFADAKVEDDLAVYSKRRFHPSQSTITNGANIEGFDPEGKNRNDRFTYNPDFEDLLSFENDSNSPLGVFLKISKGGKLQFKIKKGETFFGIIQNTFAAATDNVEIRVDGALAVFEDENGSATTGSFSAVTAVTEYQKTFFFYGLDGEEHTVEILNNDSASKNYQFEGIEVGYKPNNPTISNILNLKAGRARVKGSSVSYDEGAFTFSEPVEGKANGFTGMLKINTAGVVTAVDGISPAQTFAKAETLISFSGVVNSMEVKNSWYFPDSGICMLQLPTGQTHMFSYSSKTQTSIANHTLNGIVWSSKPSEDFTPLTGFTGGINEGRGDCSINLWAAGTITIDASNNKIDFSVNLNGVLSSVTATIDAGVYSPDLVPIETAVIKAMQVALSINGKYFLKYNSDVGLYSWGCTDPEVSEFRLLFSTGGASANSVHPTLGFSATDLTAKTSYTSTIEKRHLAQKVFLDRKEFEYVDSPKFKYSFVDNAGVQANLDDILGRMGFPSYRAFGSTGGGLIQFYPHETASGASFTFLKDRFGSYLTYQIDDGPFMYLMQGDDGDYVNEPPRAKAITSFISFPKGSHKISIRVETGIMFEVDNNSSSIYFVGAREYITKPNWESLLADEQILKCVEKSAISLYCTSYSGIAGAVYSPGGSDDSINTITEVGSWTALTPTGHFNASARKTTILNDYVEVDFTLVGDGGGISIKTSLDSFFTFKAGMFLNLSGTGITEATDRISNSQFTWGIGATPYFDQDGLGVIGLPAGTYRARFKNEQSGGQFWILAINIYDTVHPQENTNTHLDLNNTGQGLAYPVNVFRENFQKDSVKYTPSYLFRSGFKEGRVSNLNYSYNALTEFNLDDTASILTNSTMFYSRLDSAVVTEKFSYSGFFKSISFLHSCKGGAVQTSAGLMFMDGVQSANTWSARENVKGGNAPTVTRDSISRNTQKLFELSATHASGNTYNITDTRGIKNDMRIRLFDGTDYEDFTILSFVVGVSITTKKPAAIITAASVTNVFYYGFHTVELRNTNGSGTDNFRFSAVEYEALPLFESKIKQIISTKTILDQVPINFEGVANNDDAFYPFHSDGVPGNSKTSEVSIVGKSSGSATFSVPSDLKNIQVSAGNIDIRVKSTREVYEDIDGMERF